MNYTTLLFDFDGTLTPSLELWIKAYSYAFAQFNREISNETIVRRCFYRSFEDVAVEFQLPGARELKKEITDGLALFFEEAILFAGIKELLVDCANKNVKLGVVTSSPRRVVAPTLARLGIREYFDTVVTADEITNYKPHPEPVLLALKQLDSNSTGSIIIGDSAADITAGRAAGIKTALFYPEIHARFHDYAKLLETEPHFVFGDYAELVQYLFKSKSAAASLI